MDEKTSAIEQLDRAGASYRLHTYPTENGPVAALDVAAWCGFSTERLFKTLVTSDRKGGTYVFCLPAEKRMDLKKAAAVVGVKNLQMLKTEIFEELTGYTHGGCSPFGLRTPMPIYLDPSARNFDTVYVSGGRVGAVVEVEPALLERLTGAQYAEFTQE